MIERLWSTVSEGKEPLWPRPCERGLGRTEQQRRVRQRRARWVIRPFGLVETSQPSPKPRSPACLASVLHIMGKRGLAVERLQSTRRTKALKLEDVVLSSSRQRIMAMVKQSPETAEFLYNLIRGGCFSSHSEVAAGHGQERVAKSSKKYSLLPEAMCRSMLVECLPEELAALLPRKKAALLELLCFLGNLDARSAIPTRFVDDLRLGCQQLRNI